MILQVGSHRLSFKVVVSNLQGRLFLHEGFGHSHDGLEQRFHVFGHRIRLVSCNALDRRRIYDLRHEGGQRGTREQSAMAIKSISTTLPRTGSEYAWRKVSTIHKLLPT